MIVETANAAMSDRCHMATDDTDGVLARIEVARLRAGLTQQQLERDAGLAGGYLSKTRRSVRARDAQGVARVCGVRLEWLLTGAEPMVANAVPEPQTSPPSDTDAFGPELLAAIDVRRHTLADLDAARTMARDIYLSLVDEPDKVTIARRWLDIAARLRARGIEPTPKAIAGQQARSPTEEEVEARINAAVDARLREMGLDPGQGASAIAKLRQK